jgi:hypothetical protein
MSAWHIPIAADQLRRLSEDQKFRDLLLLARTANSVRFAVAAGLDTGSKDGPAAFRQRVGSYFVASAALFEAENVLRRVGRSFHSLNSWTALTDWRRDPSASALQKRVLKPLRNKAVYHNDDEVISEGLRYLGAADVVFAESESPSLIDVHYDLSDRVALAFAFEGFANGDEAAMPMQLIDASLSLARSFIELADAVIGELAVSLGLNLEHGAAPR